MFAPIQAEGNTHIDRPSADPTASWMAVGLLHSSVGYRDGEHVQTMSLMHVVSPSSECDTAQMEWRTRQRVLASSRIALMLITLAGVGVACSTRFANSPTTFKEVKVSARRPQSVGSVSRSSDSHPANHSAAPSKADAGPKDPLLDDSVAADCGAPQDNPHGYEWGVASADGSCRTCERPPLTLPPCNPGIRAQDVTQSKLKANVGKKIRFYGVVDFPWVLCTKMGGRCACPNQCAAPLRLRHRNVPIVPISSKQERISERNAILNGPYKKPSEPQEHKNFESNSSYVLLALGGIGADTRSIREYASDDGVLTCRGDENSICCPFALNRDTQKVRVIASGFLLAGPPQWMLDDTVEYRLLIEQICRVED